jgi:hypothetical protein
MGKSPSQAAADKFRPEVRKIVQQTMKQQKQIRKKFNKKTASYRGTAPESLGETQNVLASASGRTFPAYTQGTERRFFGGTSDIANAYRQVLRNFSPNILGSRSQTGLDAYLRGQQSQYGANITALGEAGRDRLFALPEQARVAFTASELNPAFNNLRNEQYMELAKNPPTVSNDAMNMYRSLFTYNV